MATLTITLDSVCAGGDHMVIGCVLDGQAKRSANVLRPDVLEPLSEEEVAAAVKVLIRLHARGKTSNQVRNNLLAGIAVTV